MIWKITIGVLIAIAFWQLLPLLVALIVLLAI